MQLCTPQQRHNEGNNEPFHLSISLGRRTSCVENLAATPCTLSLAVTLHPCGNVTKLVDITVQLHKKSQNYKSTDDDKSREVKYDKLLA